MLYYKWQHGLAMKRIDFIETYTIRIDFTGPIGLDKYLGHLSYVDVQEFIDTYIEDANVSVKVDNVSFS